MATVDDIMLGGTSAGQAKAIGGQVNLTVSAAGTTQGTATTLTASNSYISTAAANSGVILNSDEISSEFDIFNGGANAVKIYPPTGGNINQLSANTATTLPQYSAVKIKRWSSTQWIANLSA